MSWEAPGAARGVQGRVISRSGECGQAGAGVVEEPNGIASAVIGWLFNLAEPPGTVKGVVPDGGSIG